MDIKQFENLVEESCRRKKETLIEKGKEYAVDGNRFHNFDRAAEMLNITPD